MPPDTPATRFTPNTRDATRRNPPGSSTQPERRPPTLPDHHDEHTNTPTHPHGSAIPAPHDLTDQDAAERAAYWEAICAAMPPMTDEQITAVAVVLRRIDTRRANQPPK